MFARTLFAALGLAVLGSIASSGCNAGGDDSADSCLKLDDCPEWRCTCRNGQVGNTGECLNNTCTPGHDLCTTVCYDRGGLASFEAIQDVTKTAECAAFCAKADALACGGTCDKNYWCAPAKSECAAAKRAMLQCEVDTGAWQCNPGGGFTVTSACPGAACADAGLDGSSDSAADSATE